MAEIRRLMHEFKTVQRSVQTGACPFLSECELVEENLLKWIVSMTFPEDSELQKSLNTYAEHVLDESQNKLVFQVRFPPEYPMVAPELWLTKPRLKTEPGSHFTFGGRVCLAMLTSNAWEPARSMQFVFEEVHACLLQEGAIVDTSGTVKPYLPPLEMLTRLKTDAYPTANNIQVDNIQVLSPFEAGAFFGDVLHRIEATDRIALSMEHGEKIYSQRGGWTMPLMFEVKTQRGRKFHCGLHDFLAGLPPHMAVLPKWVMDEMGMRENDTVRVRGVNLDLIKSVKVQPHSIDFHRAMQESGQDPAVVLTESLRKFSALTEDTAIPVEIGSQVHKMHILELKPKAAVRIIDTDVVHDFEFKLETEFAPDLENEAERNARENELQDRVEAKRIKMEEEIAASIDKRDKAIRRHFERARDAAKREAGDIDGKTGTVTIRLVFPGSPAIDAMFPEGVSAAALLAFVLTSEWAENSNPWCVRLSQNFPKRVLTNEDVIAKDMHRSVVSVQAESPPSSDEEVLEVVEREDKQVDDSLVVRRAISSNRLTATDAENQDPGLDEATITTKTQKMYEVQRLIQLGNTEAEALSLYEAGVLAPESTSRPPPVPSFVPPARPRAPPPPRTEYEGKLERVKNFTGCDDGDARRFLDNAGGDVQRACNAFFDERLG